MKAPFSTLYELCKNRITMLELQGYELDRESLQKELDSIPESFDEYIAFSKKLAPDKKRPDFHYTEPDSLEEIRSERPDGARNRIPLQISELELKDKTYGGVFGRFIGCMLGKPLEVSWEMKNIRAYLEAVGAWELDDYLPQYSPAQRHPLRRDCAYSMKGLMSFAQPDDDINYTILGLRALETYGAGFRSQDMIRLWLDSIPFTWTWGPEHSFYFTIATYLLNHSETLPDGEEWDALTRLFNSGEELIGAMIRADAFGLTNPGMTGKASEMAYRDGSMTHKKTGLYAEMWAAAVIAAAYTTFDPVTAIMAGLEQIPGNSRYAEALREALEISLSESDWMSAYEKINSKWGYLGHAGTINESAAIINALVHSVRKDGTVDIGRAVCITVMHGWDTDCSGATAGCIAGVLCGKHNIPERWYKPLNDTYHSCVAGETDTSISALAERMYHMSRILRQSNIQDCTD